MQSLGNGKEMADPGVGRYDGELDLVRGEPAGRSSWYGVGAAGPGVRIAEVVCARSGAPVSRAERCCNRGAPRGSERRSVYAALVVAMVLALLGLVPPVWAAEVEPVAAPQSSGTAPAECRCEQVRITCSSPADIVFICKNESSIACADKRTCKLYLDSISCGLLGFRTGSWVNPSNLPPEACLLDNQTDIPIPQFLQACASVIHEAHHLKGSVCMGGGGHPVFYAEWLAFAHEGGYLGYAAEMLCKAEQVEPELEERCDLLCEDHLGALAYSYGLRCAKEFMESPGFNEIPSINRLEQHCIAQCESSYQFTPGNPNTFPPLFVSSCHQRVQDAKDLWQGACHEGITLYMPSVTTQGRTGEEVPVLDIFAQEQSLGPK